MEVSAIYFSDFFLLVFVGACIVSVLCLGVGLYLFLGGGSPWSGRIRRVLFGLLVFALLAGVLIASLAIYDSLKGSRANPQDCDDMLRRELVLSRGADVRKWMNRWVGEIQADNDRCAPEFWNPEIDDGNYWLGPRSDWIAAHRMDAAYYRSLPRCFSNTDPSVSADRFPSMAKVGDLSVPFSLYDKSLGDRVVRATSGRDSNNNIIVYWSAAPGRGPADGSICWLYVSRFKFWDKNYY